jgi:hypothetical protein
MKNKIINIEELVKNHMVFDKECPESFWSFTKFNHEETMLLMKELNIKIRSKKRIEYSTLEIRYDYKHKEDGVLYFCYYIPEDNKRREKNIEKTSRYLFYRYKQIKKLEYK